MDLKSVTLFQMAKKRMKWIGQRQEILSQNIANADTPGYRPSDLKPMDFKEIVQKESMQLNMAKSNEGHLGGLRKRIRDFAEQKDGRPFETAPGGNAVVLEEQMAKMNETQMKHDLTTRIYKKQIALMRTAIGRK